MVSCCLLLNILSTVGLVNLKLCGGGWGGGENANKHRKDIEPTHRECIAYITRSIVVIQWIAIKSHVIDATNKIFSFIVPAAGQSRRVESPDKYSCGIQNKKRVFCTKKP